MKYCSKILLGLFFLSGLTLQAQEVKESKVVLTEYEIASLAKTLQKHKQKGLQSTTKLLQKNNEMKYPILDNSLEANFLRQQIEALQNQLAQKSSAQRLNAPTATSNSNDGLIKAMQYDILELKLMMQELANKNTTSSQPTIITLPKQVEKPVVIRNDNVSSSKNDTDKVKLQFKIDSLSLQMKHLSETQSQHQQNKVLTEELELLKNNLLSDKKQSDSGITYLSYKNHIYFERGSKKLGIASFEIVDELVKIIAENPKVDILIKGFASDIGNPVFNENLSLQRTEAVKKALVNKGVHPTRILTQYHGIDYLEKSNEKAQRVDLELLTKK